MPTFTFKNPCISIPLTLAGSMITIYGVKVGQTFFFPCMVAIFFAFALGLLEPVKGWVLALVSILILWAGYWLFTTYPENPNRQQVELLALSFATGFILIISAFTGKLRKA